MTTIQSDADYQAAIKDLLVDLESRLSPVCLPLTSQQQADFTRSTLNRIAHITRSEPHLRGAVITSLADLKQLDLDNLSKDYGRLLAVAQTLYEALSQIPAARLGRALQVQRKTALERANTIL